MSVSIRATFYRSPSRTRNIYARLDPNMSVQTETAPQIHTVLETVLYTSLYTFACTFQSDI